MESSHVKENKKLKQPRGPNGRFVKMSKNGSVNDKGTKKNKKETIKTPSHPEIALIEGKERLVKHDYVSDENYFRFCQSGPELKPDEYVICMHGGEEGYIDKCLVGDEKGYRLQTTGGKNSGMSAGCSEKETSSKLQFWSGLQVVPLYRCLDGTPIVEDIGFHFAWAINYAWREVAPTQIKGVPIEEAAQKAKKVNESFSTVLFLRVNAGYLQKGDIDVEAGIPDEKRSYIKKVYKLNLVTPFESCPSFEDLRKSLEF